MKDTKTDVAFVVALTRTHTHTPHLVWKILIKVKNYVLHKRRMNETNEKHEIKRRSRIRRSRKNTTHASQPTNQPKEKPKS